VRNAVNAEPAWSVELLRERVGKAGVLTGRWTEAWRQRLVNVVLVFSDIVLALLAGEAAFVLLGVIGRGPLSEFTIASVLPTIANVLPNIAVWAGLRALLGLYPGYGLNEVEELRRQTYATLATLAIIATFVVALQLGDLVSRPALASGFLSLLLFAPLVRQFAKWRLMKAGLWGKPVIVFSSGEPGGRVATLLTKEWGLGYRPVAVFGNRSTKSTKRFEATPDEQCLADAMLLAQECGADTVIFAMPQTRRKHLAKLVNWASFGFEHVTVIPDLDGVTNSAVVARDLAGVFGVEIRYNLRNPSVRRVKRTLDLAATLMGGIVVLPLLLVVCLLVWVESGRPAFYAAQRMGRDGKLFSCLKFRTMVPDAEAVLQRMLREDPQALEEYTRYHKLREDPRVTRIGRFLRKTSLDELPQLWNVLRGEMSLVGPRPYLPRESAAIGTTQSEILRVTPGITGPWQVAGRNHTSFQERVEMDEGYVRDWSVWLDIVLLVHTLRTILFDRSAY
jgi:Undecaprenyl-phosphate galactose phosphotransferase WbaP